MEGVPQPQVLGTYDDLLGWSSEQSLHTLPVSFKLFGAAKAHGLQNAATSATEATATAYKAPQGRERRESIGMERRTKAIPEVFLSWAPKKTLPAPPFLFGGSSFKNLKKNTKKNIPYITWQPLGPLLKVKLLVDYM